LLPPLFFRHELLNKCLLKGIITQQVLIALDRPLLKYILQLVFREEGRRRRRGLGRG
jgi:hypothetical protein